MIRAAVEADAQPLAELGARFHAQSPYAHLPYDVERVAATVVGLIANGCVVVCVKNGEIAGMAAAMAGPLWFTDGMAAQELFWWADDCGEEAHGLRAALEAWASGKGCSLFTMVCLENDRAPVLARYYRRQGYVPVEHHFLKVL